VVEWFAIYGVEVGEVCLMEGSVGIFVYMDLALQVKRRAPGGE